MNALKQLVNTPVIYEAFIEEVSKRIAQANRTLEQATKIEEVYRLQGQIVALRRLLTMRNEINSSDK